MDPRASTAGVPSVGVLNILELGDGNLVIVTDGHNEWIGYIQNGQIILPYGIITALEANVIGICKQSQDVVA